MRIPSLRSNLRVAASIGLLLLHAGPAVAQEAIPADVDPWAGPKAKILLLGTFHFQGSSGDAYQPRFHVDMLSPERQRQLEEVVALLEEFRPTRIAVEAGPSRQVALDSLFDEYRAGRYRLPANEIFQLGFRLAARLGHPGVFAIDAERHDFFLNLPDYEARVAEAGDFDDALHQRYQRLYEHGDSLKVVQTLREHLLYTNAPGRILRGHGNYLIRWFKIGGDDDWFGVDFTTGWYNRNLRIFRNIQRITDSADERILVIIGSGHLPILRFAAMASPEYELVEVGEILGAASR